jgi:hypothetical protein
MFLVQCDKNPKHTVATENGADPDGELVCDCCPEDHNHAGRDCRTVTITALRGTVALQASS